MAPGAYLQYCGQLIEYEWGSQTDQARIAEVEISVLAWALVGNGGV
jgi:hypothetical protein